MSVSRSATLTNPFSTSNETLEGELKNDNVQAFSTKWDETIFLIALKAVPSRYCTNHVAF